MPDAVRPERGHALHQPHQDPGVHGRRQADRVHCGARRGAPLHPGGGGGGQPRGVPGRGGAMCLLPGPGPAAQGHRPRHGELVGQHRGGDARRTAGRRGAAARRCGCPVNTVLVVGAGFSGAVVARQLAEAGHPVLVIDKRDHIGGNAHDRLDPDGVLIHPYGPHIFHTNAARIFEYLSDFTDWRPYEHRVLASVDGMLVPLPINIDTVNRLYGLDLDESSIQAFYDRVREPRERITTSEDVVVDAVGRDLYEKFFQGYTRKQWGLDPSQLAASVAARVPARTDRDDRYFTDRYQYMPAEGYTRMFERMLDHPLITVETGVDYFQHRDRYRPRHTVYTGPVIATSGTASGRCPTAPCASSTSTCRTRSGTRRLAR